MAWGACPTVSASRRLLAAGAATVGANALPGPVAAASPSSPAAAIAPQPNLRGPAMSTIMTKDGTQIYYKDWGKGQPVVFSHGWPLSADAWDDQMFYLAERGYRAIAHDRRGHGRSS